jgi:hypothetical protein
VGRYPGYIMDTRSITCHMSCFAAANEYPYISLIHGFLPALVLYTSPERCHACTETACILSIKPYHISSGCTRNGTGLCDASVYQESRRYIPGDHTSGSKRTSSVIVSQSFMYSRMSSLCTIKMPPTWSERLPAGCPPVVSFRGATSGIWRSAS